MAARALRERDSLSRFVYVYVYLINKRFLCKDVRVDKKTDIDCKTNILHISLN